MTKSKISVIIRNYVRTRALGYCEYCKSPEDCGSVFFNIEHIFPTILGGTDDETNLAFSCGGCNGFKFTKIDAIDPISEQLVPLFNPRTQNWIDHFS
jgi:5-methylcytosine-specific restriction endonuclease McrA